jgi:rhodanese-related sulfurtransferase
MVLSGDSLFVGDVGRPDFGGPVGAIQQYHSVNKLLQLEDYVEVFPAHFEGACGKGMCGRPSSTIGFERRFNPLLQLSEPEFLELSSQVPARPLNMSAILAANRGESGFPWPHVGHDVMVPSVGSVEAAAWLRKHHAIVIDVREPWEYAEGHIPGALSVPQAELAVRLAELPKDRPALLASASGNRSMRAAGFLKGVGYSRVANLAGGTDGWTEVGNPVQTGI